MTTELVEAPPRPQRKSAEPPVTSKPTPVGRLLSLDAYRGLVMLAMISSGLGLAHLARAHLPPSVLNRILVTVADQLEHREWDMAFSTPNLPPGAAAQDPDQVRQEEATSFIPWQICTPWDMIQPSFMFIVGVAMPFAFARRQERGESWRRQFGHAILRSLLLIAIGVFLDVFSSDKMPFVQLIRVLQQIALGYLVAFLVLRLGPLVQASAAALLLVGHTLAFLIYGWATSSYPWYGGHNVGLALDQFLHRTFSCDPYVGIFPLSEGHYVTLNAVSSAATILFGVLAGELLRTRWRDSNKLLILTAVGIAGIALGIALSPVVPINKKIWTASFALFAGGLTSLLLAFLYWIIDVLQYRRWTFPLVVIGMNSIAIYVMSGTIGGGIKRFWQNSLGWPVAADPNHGGLATAASHWLQQHFGWPLDGTLALCSPIFLAVLTVVIEWLFCYWLYRRRIFFKV